MKEGIKALEKLLDDIENWEFEVSDKLEQFKEEIERIIRTLEKEKM